MASPHEVPLAENPSVVAGPDRPPTRRSAGGRAIAQRNWSALVGVAGIAPYFLFIFLFLLLPVLANLWQMVHDSQGEFSLGAVEAVFEAQYLEAYANSIRLSVVTALIGGVLGLILAWAIATGGRPAWLRRMVLSYSGVASQLGGVALAFAFFAALGAQGIVTVLIRDLLGFDLSEALGFGSFWGLVVVYLYFEVPLMAILVLPAFAGLRREWRESAENLGVGGFRYTVDIALPIMAPAVVGAMLLLFADSFSAYATAYALTGGSANLIPITIGFFISGNVFVDNSFGAALVTGMILIVAAALGLRVLFEQRTTRWLR